MTPVQLWLVAAIVLFILEVITPGFVLANFGVAALAAGVVAWAGGGMVAQVITFCVVCLLSFVTIRPFLQKTIFRDGRRARTGTDALIGRMAKVSEDIPSAPDTGRVLIDGDDWRAMSLNGGPIHAGAVVRIVRVDSTTVIVSEQ